MDKLRAYCEAHGIPARFIHVDTLAQAKALPCVFNNWAVLYQGRFVTVNQLDGSALEKLLRENRQLKEEVAKAQTHVDQHMSTELSLIHISEPTRPY